MLLLIPRSLSILVSGITNVAFLSKATISWIMNGNIAKFIFERLQLQETYRYSSSLAVKVTVKGYSCNLTT